MCGFVFVYIADEFF